MSSTFNFDINFNLLANEVKKMKIESMIINASNNEANKHVATDYNYNYSSYKPFADIPTDDTKFYDSDSTTDSLPQLEEMEVAQEATDPQKPISDVECQLVGYAKIVIPVTKEIVVQPLAGSKILDLGTPIFVEQNVGGQEKYRQIGSIWDIFGTLNEPMYSVVMSKETSICDSFIVGCKMFFMYGHPETRYLNIECDGDSYTVKHNQSF